MNKVYIVRGEHYAVPGEYFSVHVTRASAVLAALAVLNILREELRMPRAMIFHDNTVKATIRRAEQTYGAVDCDVWIEEHRVQQ